MPARDRAPSVQWYYRDWMADPGVQGLSWEERGRYHWALCCTHETDVPGLATEDQWRRWMAYPQAEWGAHRTALAACFRVRPDGMWLQKRANNEWKVRRNRFKNARKGATATNEKRWGSVAKRPSKRRSSDRSGDRSGVSPASASASASAVDTPPPLIRTPEHGRPAYGGTAGLAHSPGTPGSLAADVAAALANLPGPARAAPGVFDDRLIRRLERQYAKRPPGFVFDQATAIAREIAAGEQVDNPNALLIARCRERSPASAGKIPLDAGAPIPADGAS